MVFLEWFCWKQKTRRTDPISLFVHTFVAESISGHELNCDRLHLSAGCLTGEFSFVLYFCTENRSFLHLWQLYGSVGVLTNSRIDMLVFVVYLIR